MLIINIVSWSPPEHIFIYIKEDSLLNKEPFIFISGFLFERPQNRINTKMEVIKAKVARSI